MIGLGAFRILSLLDEMYWVALGVRIFAVNLAVGVALMSIWDAIQWYRTHDTARMKVQLPKGIKLLIHIVIRGNLSSGRIMIAAAYGLRWQRLSQFTQNHLALMKLLLALVLLGLAAFISMGK